MWPPGPFPSKPALLLVASVWLPWPLWSCNSFLQGCGELWGRGYSVEHAGCWGWFEFFSVCTLQVFIASQWPPELSTPLQTTPSHIWVWPVSVSEEKTLRPQLEKGPRTMVEPCSQHVLWSGPWVALHGHRTPGPPWGSSALTLPFCIKHQILPLPWKGWGVSSCPPHGGRNCVFVIKSWPQPVALEFCFDHKVSRGWSNTC